MEMVASDPNESHLSTSQPVEITTKSDEVDAIHSSENLVPDSQDQHSTEAAGAAGDYNSGQQEVNSVTKVEGENKIEQQEDVAANNQVSSTTESFSSESEQQNSHGLPSINHQSVVVPNMEPYLEEGSLDGIKEEDHPPDVTSTESDQAIKDEPSVDSTSSQSIVNEVPTNTETSVADTSSQEQDVTGDVEQQAQLPDSEPTSVQGEETPIVSEEPATTEMEVVRSDNEAVISEEQVVGSADSLQENGTAQCFEGGEPLMEQVMEPEPVTASEMCMEESADSQPDPGAENTGISEEESQQQNENAEQIASLEPSETVLDQQYMEQEQYMDSAQEQMEDPAMQPLEQTASVPDGEHVPEHQMVNQIVEHSSDQIAEQLPVQAMEQAPDDQLADQTMADHQIPVEMMEQGLPNQQILEHLPEQPVQDHQLQSHMLGQQLPDQQLAEQHMLEEQMLQQQTLEQHISEQQQLLQQQALEQQMMQQQMPVQLSNQIMEHMPSQQVPQGHEMMQDQSMISGQSIIAGGTMSSQSVMQDHQSAAVQMQGQTLILEQQIPVQQQDPMESNSAVCEADTSAAYSGHQMGAQSVYVVDESGGLTLNSINRDASMAGYHNSDAGASAGHMLVEMAPMSTDGSYVNTHAQVRYVDASSLGCDGGQEGGMISDAQAAELLMRVSEQRPTLSLQDPSCSTVPYVQVQLAQTVEGITHLVEVPVSALGYLPSTLVYTTPVNSGATVAGGTEMSTWVVEAPPGVDQQHHVQAQHPHQAHTVENKFSDIVSASIEAIGFPESVTPGTTILSQAEQILIASDGTGHHHHHHIDPSSSSGATAASFDFDDSSSNSSMTLIGTEAKAHGSSSTYPRPKRESIESRINRLLRGANAPPGPDPVNEDWMPPTKSAGATVKTLKLAPVQSTAAIGNKLSSGASSPATVTLNLNDSGAVNPPKPRVSVSRSSLPRTGATVSIPTIYTSTTVKPVTSSSSTLPPLPPGHTDYLMPRGVSKRKAQTQKVTKVNPLNPNCIDADPAPPEETQVKLVMNVDANAELQDVTEDDSKDDEDEYNRLVLLQARQRQQTERGSDTNRFRMGRNRQMTFLNRSLQEVTVSSPAPIRRISETDASDTLLSLSAVEKKPEASAPAKRARLSFPPEKYADLDAAPTYTNITTYMTELQTPKLTYSSPRTRQIRTNIRNVKDETPVDQPTVPVVRMEPKDVTVQPLANAAEEREKRLPRIIRQSGNAEPKSRLSTESRDTSAMDEDEDVEMDSTEQVIVIGLDETGKQPSEEQLTAIIQAAMTKQEKVSVTATKESAAPPRPARPAVASTSPPAVKTSPSAPVKRKVGEEDNGIENEEHPVQVKVIRTYDRNHGLTRRKPRTKQRTVFLDIFDFKQDEEEEEEEGEEEEVDELEPFSQALADEENRLREQELQRQQTASATSPGVSSARKETPSSGTSPATYSRSRGGRGKARNSADSRSIKTRGKGRGRGAKRSQSTDASGGKVAKPARSTARKSNSVDGPAEDDAFDLSYVDDANDDDYQPSRGRGRGRSRGRSRGRGRRSVERRSVSKADEEDEKDEKEAEGAAEAVEEEEVEENEGELSLDKEEEAEEEDADQDEEEDDDDDEEMKIPGLPTKPCPQCQERFTTQEGFLEHVTSHTSAKCLVCNWKNPGGEKKPLLQHMLNSHRNAIPTARSNSR